MRRGGGGEPGMAAGGSGEGAQTRGGAAPTPRPAPRRLLPTLTLRYVMPAFAGRLVSMDLMMYTPDKMMSDKSPLPISAPGPCFPGRYSPTYRSPDPMRRCMPNPPVSTVIQCVNKVIPSTNNPSDNNPVFYSRRFHVVINTLCL